MRSWNLSSIWSIPTAAGAAWLKSVPPFFAHEGRIIDWLGDPALPPLLGFADGRVLMAEIGGDDQYDARLPTLVQAVDTLVAIQDRVSNRVDELLALGLPDWRWPVLAVLIDDVIERHGRELDGEEQRVLARVVSGLDDRIRAIDACGLPMTLVHGDFHRGNLRGTGDGLALLDWGDCGVGHPLFDLPAMIEPLTPDVRASLLTHWVRAWQERRAGSDPLRAQALVQPIAALRQALIYRGFLDAIEPSERVYHERDPAGWLRRAASLAAEPQV
jgi:Ser/Thr protein kinase RdoA (MazF antagonist)